ncbi:MAG: hypothetical protein QXJ95_06675 [Ignisphaera sp.]|uniref:Uncharacterized protein n=1 Tax=Ignisphaera aggregans TaxID=334771 RepID=A0A7J3I864_9CREN
MALSGALPASLDPLFNFLYIVPSIPIAAVVALAAGFRAHIVAIALRLLPAFYRIVKTLAMTVASQP